MYYVWDARYHTDEDATCLLITDDLDDATESAHEFGFGTVVTQEIDGKQCVVYTVREPGKGTNGNVD